MPKTVVPLASGERSLHGIEFNASDPTGQAVLLGHGYDGNQRMLKNYANPLASRGITCLSFDLGGHGKSEGEQDELTADDHVADMLAAYDHLAAHPNVDPQRIGIIGMSYSGYLACLSSSERPIRSLLLRAPPLLANRFRHVKHGEYSGEEALRERPAPDNEALIKAGQFSGKIVLVKMEHDELVLPCVTDAYEAAINEGGVETIHGAGHFLTHETQPAFQSVVKEWSTSL